MTVSNDNHDRILLLTYAVLYLHSVFILDCVCVCVCVCVYVCLFFSLTYPPVRASDPRESKREREREIVGMYTYSTQYCLDVSITPLLSWL